MAMEINGFGTEAPDDLREPDPEEAAICLECGEPRCLLDDGKPCFRYGRMMRALRKERGECAPPADRAASEKRASE